MKARALWIVFFICGGAWMLAAIGCTRGEPSNPNAPRATVTHPFSVAPPKSAMDGAQPPRGLGAK